METHNTTKNENNHEDKDPIPAIMEDNKSEARSNSSVFVEEEENEIEVPGVKKEIQKNSSRKKYHNIPNEMRLKLIEYVENKGEKIKHAAKRFGINYSSAKSICQVYKKEGRTNKKTFKRRSGREDISMKDKIETSMDQANGNQGSQPNNYFEENEQPETSINKEMEKDNTLLALRDRLLESKSKKPQNQAIDVQYKTPEEFADAITQESNLGQTVGIKQLHQLDKVIAQNNQILTLGQPQQKTILSTPPIIKQQPTQIYIIPPQQQMGQMYINNGQSFPNFMGQLQQTITPNHGPVQTININQPQTKVLNISSNNQPEQQGILQSNINNIQAYHYADQSPIPIQQHNSYMIINPTLQQQQQQIGGYQMVQPIYYIVPQNYSPFSNLQYVSGQEYSYAVPQQNVMVMNYPQYQDTYKVKTQTEFGNNNIQNNNNPLGSLEAKFKNPEEAVPIIKEDEKA